jgi:hypothetical protein
MLSGWLHHQLKTNSKDSKDYGCTQLKNKRRITKKEKSHYSDLFLVAAQAPPKQHQKSNFSNSDK